MRKLCSFITLFALPLFVFSVARTREEAKEIASSFVRQTEMFTVNANVEFSEPASKGQNNVKSLHGYSSDYYILNIKNEGGYVIVSGDNRFRDVLGYGTVGNIDVDNMPDGLQYLLSSLSQEMQAAKAYYDANGIETVESEGNLLTNLGYASVAPLINTHWHQAAPLNGQVPVGYDSSYSSYKGRAAVGCVALAIAQVMNYWKYPTQGQGGVHANPYYQNVNVNFSEQSYNWDNVATEYGWYLNDNGNWQEGIYTDSQATEIAKICYNVGVAVDMQWNVNGDGQSGTFDNLIISAMHNYFGYNQYAKIQYRDMLGVEGFSKAIIGDLAAGRPVIFSADSEIGGHSFILDGYDASMGMFHVNWGWQGQNNGFYALTAMNTNKGNYVSNQTALCGVQPTEEDFGMAPSVYFKSLTPIVSSITKGEYIPFLIDTLIYDDRMFSGTIGMAVFNSQGTMVLDKIDIHLNDIGWYSQLSYGSPTIPKSMSAGNYTMRMMLRTDDGKYYPMPAQYGKPESWTLTVSSNAPNGKVTITADVPTGIDDIYASGEDYSKSQDNPNYNQWYTITGTPVTSPQKGIYIRNGKKYIFR